eukprot:7804439-Pyramimonas_sp.AAC.1
MWLSPHRHARLFETFARASRIESGSFSNCGFRLSAHIRCSNLQEAHGLRADRFQNVAPASAQRTF